MKQTPKKLPKPFKRKIHFESTEIWSYQIHHGGIRIQSPGGKTYKITMEDFTGWSPDELERAAWKKYWPKIGPQVIKNYINEHLK
ncbi:MAG TPA: hypothetical protein VMX17_15695 [Candidatus Glassbacteria bacterium]|nr:hypothetical protein [Candidatus Glassbacteria bacterium]